MFRKLAVFSFLVLSCSLAFAQAVAPTSSSTPSATSSIGQQLLAQLPMLIFSVGGLVLAFVLAWLVRKGVISDTLKQAIDAAAQRAKDKYLTLISVASSPTSPGGIVVTDEEKSEARAEALKSLLSMLTGPALTYAKEKGEEWLKGLLGIKLDQKLEAAGVITVPESSVIVAK